MGLKPDANVDQFKGRRSQQAKGVVWMRSNAAHEGTAPTRAVRKSPAENKRTPSRPNSPKLQEIHGSLIYSLVRMTPN